MAAEITLPWFDEAVDAFLLVDRLGRLRYANRAAMSLLDCNQCASLGQPCWTVVRMLRVDGSAWCRADCPVRSLLADGASFARQRLLRRTRDGDARAVELSSLPIRCDDLADVGVLHLIRPIGLPRADPQTDRLRTLTDRECQVLDRLAVGDSTRDIAERLCISRATARNHVQNILRKLGVHRQTAAALVWIRRQSGE